MKPKFYHRNAHLNIKWKCDLDRQVIFENMEERNWENTDPDDDDWNFYWSSIKNIRKIFHPHSKIRLQDD